MRILLTALLALYGTFAPPAAANPGRPALEEMGPRTLQLATMAVVREAPEGRIVDVWDDQTLFTAHSTSGDWVKISGHFPDKRWQPLEQELWVLKHYVRDITDSRPRGFPTDPDAERRYIVVDKSRFELTVFERRSEGEKAIFSTRVAVGMDRCLPKAKGGRCYYTEPGEYQVRWKVYDPKGIEWCIPEFMEQEYASSVAQGKRCFRGPLGNYALNIGKSYAIHGTNRPQSLGKKVSHGCIRVANGAMEKLFHLMGEGARVLITE